MAGKKKNLFNDEMPDGANAHAEYLSKNGVTAPWLANLLKMDRQIVNKKLADCPKLKKTGKTSGAFYDILTALQYLVPPLVDWDEWIRTADRKDMPSEVRREYFASKREEIKYWEESNNLFHAVEISRQITIMMITIKSKFQTAPSEIEKYHPLTAEHVKAIHTYLDDVLMSIRADLLVFAENNQLKSILADDEDVIEPTPNISKEEFLSGFRAKIKAHT